MKRKGLKVARQQEAGVPKYRQMLVILIYMLGEISLNTLKAFDNNYIEKHNARNFCFTIEKEH